MSNINSFSDVILRQNNSQPLIFSNAGPIHGQVQMGASAAVLSLPNPLAPIDSGAFFPGRAATAIPFLIRIAGTYAVSGNLQIDLNQGTGLSPAVASSGLIAGSTVNNPDNWFIECPMMWDAASTNLRGLQYGWVGGTAIAQAAIVKSSPANLAALQFNIGVTFTSPNPGNNITVTEFSAELT